MSFAGWPRIDPSARRSDADPRTLGFLAGVWIVTLLLCLIPAYVRTTGIDLREMAILVILHATLVFGAYPFRSLSDDHPVVRGIYTVVPFWVCSLTCLFVVFSDSQSPLVWAFYYLYMGVMAQAYGLNLWLFLLSVAAPLATAQWFQVHGIAREALAVPLSNAVVGPVTYLLLGQRAGRKRQLQRENELTRTLLARAQEEQERLHLIADVEARLGGVLASARQAVAGVESGGDMRVLAGLIHEALYELRASVWSLDPRDTPWSAIEAHVRRLAPALTAPHPCSIETEVKATGTLSPPGRVALIRALRLHLSAAPSAIRMRVDARGLDLEIRSGTAAVQIALDGFRVTSPPARQPAKTAA